jgi:hypothetical protein
LPKFHSSDFKKEPKAARDGDLQFCHRGGERAVDVVDIVGCNFTVLRGIDNERPGFRLGARPPSLLPRDAIARRMLSLNALTPQASRASTSKSWRRGPHQQFPV